MFSSLVRVATLAISGQPFSPYIEYICLCIYLWPHIYAAAAVTVAAAGYRGVMVSSTKYSKSQSHAHFNWYSAPQRCGNFCWKIYMGDLAAATVMALAAVATSAAAAASAEVAATATATAVESAWQRLQSLRATLAAVWQTFFTECAKATAKRPGSQLHV